MILKGVYLANILISLLGIYAGIAKNHLYLLSASIITIVISLIFLAVSFFQNRSDNEISKNSRLTPPNENSKSEIPGVTDLTKIIINKTHGGRKQDSKFWQSEFGENTTTQNEKSGLTIIPLILAAMTGSVVGSLLLITFFQKDIIINIPENVIKPYIKDSHIGSIPLARSSKNMESEQKAPSSAEKPYIKNQQGKEYSVSDQQLNKAIEKALQENRVRSQNDKNLNQGKYQYEIELYSGGKIYIDNADIGKDAIRYRSDRGLLISLNRKEIKTMKRVKVY